MEQRIAVYGSLRKGMHNHTLIEDAKYLGRYETKPIYNMYAVSTYPGLKLQGNTSIVMEVYEVDNELLSLVDRLEGYSPHATNNDFYNRVTINTPFGLAYTYLYVPDIPEHAQPVYEGDWVNFKNDESLKNLLINAEIF
jgi:gamma-glutamylcyclotransferase (GGCT)/AIG2-like uncharacterized protein YtfP